MDSYWAYACAQHPCESTYEYFERYKCYLDENPYHGFQFHELITHFLDGMLNEECYTLYLMAGKHLMDCTPSEVWCLIEERAVRTKPCSPKLVQAISEIKEDLTKISKKVDEMIEMNNQWKGFNEKWVEFAEDEREQQSALEAHEFSPEDEEVPLSMKDRDDEVVVDAELQVVPMINMEDVPPEERISPPCSDIILEQNLVITRNPIILPIFKMVLSFNMQNDKIKEALCNTQVWGSLEEDAIHDPRVRTHMITLASDQVLDKFCMNWKTRKKGKEMIRCSEKKSDIHSSDARSLGPTRRPMKLHLNWKKRKKGKCIFGHAEFSMLSVNVQKNRASFGWKPGWISCKNASHKVTKRSRRFWKVEGNSFHQHYCPNLAVRKFDGIHPWAPNI